jgi:hypothetical protein
MKCGRMVFKLYKIQTKSENHETCRDVMLSYVETVIKILRRFCARWHVRYLQTRHLHMWSHITWNMVSWFISIYAFTCAKPSQFFITVSTYVIVTSRQVSWFSDGVFILYILKTIHPQVRGHVSWTTCSKFMAYPWMRPKIRLNNKNIIFSSIFLYPNDQ